MHAAEPAPAIPASVRTPTPSITEPTTPPAIVPPVPPTAPARPVAEPALPPVARRPVPEPVPVSLALPPESGLVLVETVHKAAPAPEPEAATAGPRRVRPPRVEIPAEPLQMVETHKENPPPAP